MRKLYALLAGLCIGLASIQTIAQQPTADLANFTYAINASDNNVAFTNTSVIGAEPGNRRAFWSFGDGSSQWSDQFDNAKHEYLSAGTYTVCLRIYKYVTNSNDPVLSAEICKTIIIESKCRADFEFRDSIAHVDPLKHLVYFWAIPFINPNKPVTQVCWNFGDGTDTCINISSTVPPTNLLTIQHTYYKQGSYNVCVRIKYLDGCVAEKCKLIVLPNPQPDICSADFERLPVTTSNNLFTVAYKAIPWHNHNKKPTTICWSFGDGKDTCIKYMNIRNIRYAVAHTYRQPGLYEVCVKILYNGGCESKKCKPIQVGRPDSCKANFERLPVTSTNDPLEVYLKALPWHNNNKKPAAICWTFGDGKDTCIKYESTYTGNYILSRSYKEPGQYEVCVKIFYYGGCESKWCKLIKIERPDKCSADFERIPTTANIPLRVYFRALPKHNNNKNPERICWKFGDGRDTCIKYEPALNNQYVVAHNYLQPGSYEVCVSILYAGGCEAKECKVIKIDEPDNCSADFETMSTASNSLHKYFIAKPWHNHNKKPVYICWKFGDNRDTCIQYSNTYSEPYAVAHTYNNAGQYEVCVRIVYDGSCESKKCKIIVVPPIGHDTCAVKLFEITPSATSLVRGFYVSTSATDKKPERICWYFGDGTDTCVQSNTPNPILLPDNFFIRHTYPGPGVYRACVKVLFQGGCIAADCKEVVIRPVSNICGGFMIDSLIEHRTFVFKGFSIHQPNDEVISYWWSFGDGSSAAGKEVKHTYNVGGTYEICLTIKTKLGCEARICKAVRIPGNNEPVLHLSPNPVINVLHVQFFSTHTEQVSIKIFNTWGVGIKSYMQNVTAGQNTWDLDLANLMPGVYSFVVQSPNQLASAIFLKQ